MSVPRWSATSNVLLKSGMILQVEPSRSPRHEDQMSGRGDREQLGRALDDAEDECLPVGELAGRLPHAQRGEHDGESERGRRERHDESAHDGSPARVWRMRYRRRATTALFLRLRRRARGRGARPSTELSTSCKKGCGNVENMKFPQIAAMTFCDPLTALSETLDCVLRRARSASRSKPSPKAVAGRRKSAETVDESETGSANFFGPMRERRHRICARSSR